MSPDGERSLPKVGSLENATDAYSDGEIVKVELNTPSTSTDSKIVTNHSFETEDSLIEITECEGNEMSPDGERSLPKVGSLENATDAYSDGEIVKVESSTPSTSTDPKLMTDHSFEAEDSLIETTECKEKYMSPDEKLSLSKIGSLDDTADAYSDVDIVKIGSNTPSTSTDPKLMTNHSFDTEDPLTETPHSNLPIRQEQYYSRINDTDGPVSYNTGVPNIQEDIESQNVIKRVPRQSRAVGFLWRFKSYALVLCFLWTLATTSLASWLWQQLIPVPGLNRQVKSLATQNKKFSDQNTRLADEIVDLEGNIRQLNYSVEELKYQNAQFELSNEQLIMSNDNFDILNNDLKTSVTLLKGSVEELNATNILLDQQNNLLNELNNDYTDINNELKTEVDSLSAEVDGLNRTQILLNDTLVTAKVLNEELNLTYMEAAQLQSNLNQTIDTLVSETFRLNEDNIYQRELAVNLSTVISLLDEIPDLLNKTFTRWEQELDTNKSIQIVVVGEALQDSIIEIEESWTCSLAENFPENWMFLANKNMPFGDIKNYEMLMSYVESYVFTELCIQKDNFEDFLSYEYDGKSPEQLHYYDVKGAVNRYILGGLLDHYFPDGTEVELSYDQWFEYDHQCANFPSELLYEWTPPNL